MTGAALAGRPPRGVTIGGHRYPVVLPTVRDPRLHLAAVITSLQVLGQTSLGFRVSIAQILIAVGTCAVLELSMTAWRDRALVWPASAMLTGNGVAFILRVPGTEHGDWWSTNGAWIYAGTAAIALLSKYAIRWRGRHIFNPSNFGLVLCFLVLGSSRAEPLDFWWGSLSPALVLALLIILVGGLAILSRIKLLSLAVAFWVTFAIALIPVAAAGHGMTARWHLGPVSGFDFWWVLVTSPEILIFLFFMITDPKTIPTGTRARILYACTVAVLATLLLAPAETEFGAKVAVLGALVITCALRPVIERVATLRVRIGWAVPATAAAAAVLALIASPPQAGFADKLRESAAWPAAPPANVPPHTVIPSPEIASRITPAQARQMANDLTVALQMQTEGLRRRDAERAAIGTGALWLSKLEERMERVRAGGRLAVPAYDVKRVELTLALRPGQVAPAIMATLYGTTVTESWAGTPPRRTATSQPAPLQKSFEIAKAHTHYQIVSDELPPDWQPGPR